MGKYRIDWTENVYYTMEVEAESEQDALDKFHSGEYDLDNGRNYGVEMEDSVDVREAE
jgi:hypothetical protein